MGWPRRNLREVHSSRAMTYVMVDVESDGPIPGDYSMVCFGAVVVDENLDRTFYARLSPISEKWVSEALAVSGFGCHWPASLGVGFGHLHCATVSEQQDLWRQ